MSGTDKAILVVDSNRTTSENVKELIEFMDSPCVVTAIPEEWLERLGGRRLEALFVGPDLSDASVDGLFDDLAKLDPNVPVVMMRGNS